MRNIVPKIIRPVSRYAASREKALLVGVSRPPTVFKWQVQDYLNELELLADTAGASVLEKFIQEREAIDPVYFIGKGKAAELALRVEADGIDLVIFDEDLSPVQIRNLEETLRCKILDRTALILQIFAVRAKSASSKMQVELAQLEYLLPRLTRLWTHLSKQKGGIGTKGPGETQIETDRRLVSQRISVLRQKLKTVGRQRETQTKWREALIRISLVGYTNAGKSTLMNALCPKSGVKGEDRLFATLDATTRRIELETNKHALLSDTVGFIRKLPHNLVESFKSTLDEVRDSDVLLHVVDLSHPNFEEQIEVVEKTLTEIGAASKTTVMVFNKIDLVDLSDETRGLTALQEKYPNAVFVSAERGINIIGLREALSTVMETEFESRDARIPVSNYKLVSYLHDAAEVLEKHYEGETVVMRLRVPRKILKKVDGLLSRAAVPLENED